MLNSLRPRARAWPFCACVLLALGQASAQEPEGEEDDLVIPAAPEAPASPRPVAPAPARPDVATDDPQAAPDAEEPAGDELEVPSAPGPAPVPPAPGAAAGEPPPGDTAPAPASSSTSDLPPHDAAGASLSPPAAPGEGALPVAAPAPSAERRTLPTGNLELTAHSRPVPLGLLFSGFLQAQLVNNRLSEDQLEQSGEPLNRDQFELRAARLRLDGGHEYTAYTLELDASTRGGPSVGIRRAEGSLLYRGARGSAGVPQSSGPPLLALTAGVTDVPFGYELVESSRTRAFMERSAGSEAIFPTQMDTGVKLHGAWTFLRYAVALVNGEPVDRAALPRDRNAAKDVIGRFGAEVPVAESVAISGGTSFSFGKGFHPGRLAVKDSVAWRDDNNDGVAIPNELIGVPGSAATPSESFERWALGLDLQLQVRSPIGFTRLAAEAFVAQNHDRGRVVSDPVEVGFDLRQVGAYLAVTQDLSPYALVGVRVESYDPNSDLFEERRGELIARSEDVLTLSPIVGLVLPQRARLLFQYDLVRDELGRDAVGTPTDARNDQFTARLQVDL